MPCFHAENEAFRATHSYPFVQPGVNKRSRSMPGGELCAQRQSGRYHGGLPVRARLLVRLALLEVYATRAAFDTRGSAMLDREGRGIRAATSAPERRAACPIRIRERPSDHDPSGRRTCSDRPTRRTRHEHSHGTGRQAGITHVSFKVTSSARNAARRESFKICARSSSATPTATRADAYAREEPETRSGRLRPVPIHSRRHRGIDGCSSVSSFSA